MKAGPIRASFAQSRKTFRMYGVFIGDFVFRNTDKR